MKAVILIDEERKPLSVNIGRVFYDPVTGQTAFVKPRVRCKTQRLTIKVNDASYNGFNEAMKKFSELEEYSGYGYGIAEVMLKIQQGK